MAIDVYAAFDMHQNTIDEFALQSGAAFPTSPVLGQLFVLTPGNNPFMWNGTAWVGMTNASSKFAATIGDGLALAYPVTHNLGTLDTIESVYSVSTGLEQVAVVQHTSANVTTFTFSIPPLLNSVRVVIHA